MRILLDTHCWLWWLMEPSRLSQHTLAIINDSQNEVCLSVASCWEIAIKHSIGKLQFDEPLDSFIQSRLKRDNIRIIEINLTHALRVATLPHHHRDPFDRLIIAQAQVEQIPIVTADAQFANYDVAVIPA